MSIEVKENSGSDNWPDVITSDVIFNLPQGTVFTYDSSIGKYVSVIEDEDIGPGETYYYSGSSVALDPGIIFKDFEDLFDTIPIDYRIEVEQLPEGYYNDKGEKSEEVDEDHPKDVMVGHFNINQLEGRISKLENIVVNLQDYRKFEEMLTYLKLNFNEDFIGRNCPYWLDVEIKKRLKEWLKDS